MAEHIEANKLITVNSDEYIQFLYAIHDKKNEKIAVAAIRSEMDKNNLPESMIFPDYMKSVTKKNRTWRKRQKLNVYTDSSSMKDDENMTGIKKGEWERVYWYIYEKPSIEDAVVEEKPKATMKKV